MGSTPQIEIECTSAHGSICSTGTLLRFDSDGLFVQSDSGREFISREIITRLKVWPPASTGPTGGTSLTIKSAVDALIPPNPVDAVTSALQDSASPSEPRPNDAELPADQAQPAPPQSQVRIAIDPDWQLLFAAEPQLSPPEPRFQIDNLDADAREALVRAKNRYEYAVKINELGRIRADIAPLVRHASALRSAGLFTVAGLLALKIKDFVKAKECLALAEELNDPEGAYGLAFIAISDSAWRVAAEKAIRVLLLKAAFSEADLNLVQNLGRCLNRLEDRELPGLAELVQRTQGSLVSELVATVAAFSLHSKNPEAARLLRAGQVDQAHIAASDSVVFTKAVILQERLKELERSRRSTSTSGDPSAERPHHRILSIRSFWFHL